MSVKRQIELYKDVPSNEIIDEIIATVNEGFYSEGRLLPVLREYADQMSIVHSLLYVLRERNLD